MTFRQGAEEYYQKFIELQEKLRSSEEERLKLEMKFNEMVQVTRDEEQMYYRRLRSQYKHFLEENSRRQERNDRILRLMERIESRASILEAKTRRIQLLRTQYRAILERISKGVGSAKPKVPTKDDYKEDILKKYLEMQKQIQSSQIAEQIMQSIQSRKSTKDFIPESINNRSKLACPELSKLHDYNTTKSMNNNQFDDLLDACSDLKNLPMDIGNTPVSGKNFENLEKKNWLPKIASTSQAENVKEKSNGSQIEDSIGDLSQTDGKVKENNKIAEKEYNKNDSNSVINVQDEINIGVSDTITDVNDTNKEIDPKENKELQEDTEVVETIDLDELKQDKIVTDEITNKDISPTEIINKEENLENSTIKNGETIKEMHEPYNMQENKYKQVNIDRASRMNDEAIEELGGSNDNIETIQENEENIVKEQINLGDIVKETNDGDVEITIIQEIADESSFKIDAVEAKKENEVILDGNVVSEDVNIEVKEEIEAIVDGNVVSEDVNIEAKEEIENQDVTVDVKEVLVEDKVTEDQAAPIEQSGIVQFDENGQVYDASGDRHQNDGDQLGYGGAIEDGKVVSEDTKEEDQMQSDLVQPEILYDENGQAYDASGNQYQYDNNEGYDGNYDASQVQYDENGQPIVYDESAYYDENGQPIYYDENGQPIQYDETMQYDENGLPVQQEYEYENAGDQEEFAEGPETSDIQDVGNESKDAVIDENDKKKVNVIDMLETDSESSKQETKASNGSDFDFSNA